MGCNGIHSGSYDGDKQSFVEPFVVRPGVVLTGLRLCVLKVPCYDTMEIEKNMETNI